MSSPTNESSAPENNENITLPESALSLLVKGSKVIIPPQKITEKVKKERTQKQIEAFEKMRAKRLENDEKRKLAKGETQKVKDDIKIQQEKEEEEERQKRAQELKEKLGVNVEVLKKRGRKAGQHIPYKQSSTPSQPTEEPVKITPQLLEEKPTYTNPYMSMLLNKMRR